MANLGKVILVLTYYAAAFLSFGSLITRKREQKEFSFTRAWVFGFFAYHVIFQIVTVPVMLLQKPLSLLTQIWTGIIGAVILYAVIRYGKIWIQAGTDRVKGLFGKDWMGWISILVAGASVILVSVIYVSFWDATYYVGQVSFSVYTDTINQIDPLSGEYLKAFDWKHCLATYHVNDAVICQLFDIHPLIETKTIMVAIIALLTNMLYYRIGCRLFHNKKEAVALFMLLTLVVNVCTYSAYTASSFLMYRTYEGKAITANLSIPAILYLLLGLYGEGEKKEFWLSVLLICWGSVAVASSAMFLVPVTLAAGVIPYAVWKKHPMAIGKMCFCIIPCIAVIACYLLGRMGWLKIAILH